MLPYLGVVEESSRKLEDGFTCGAVSSDRKVMDIIVVEDRNAKESQDGLIQDSSTLAPLRRTPRSPCNLRVDARLPQRRSYYYFRLTRHLPLAAGPPIDPRR